MATTAEQVQTDTDTPPRRGTIAWYEQEVQRLNVALEQARDVDEDRIQNLEIDRSDLREELRQEQASREAQDTRIAQLDEMVTQLTAAVTDKQAELEAQNQRIERFTTMLHDEADSRGLCSDYDRIVARAGLIPRNQQWTVEVSVEFDMTQTVEARGEDRVREMVNDDEWIRNMIMRAFDPYNHGTTYEDLETEVSVYIAE